MAVRCNPSHHTVKYMLRRVIFVSRHTAESTAGWPDWAVISLNDPYAALGDANLMAGWHAVHRSAFHDINPNYPSGEMDEFLECMTEEQAKAIVGFVRKVAPAVEGILVHCNAGVSRSAAVAKWIAEQYDLPLNSRYDKFNQHVFEQLIAASNLS